MDSWWQAHRSSAPNLFVDELEAAKERISLQPKSFPVHAETPAGTVRRAPMPKTRNHVYYLVREDEGHILIVSVWGGPGGRGPDLG